MNDTSTDYYKEKKNAKNPKKNDAKKGKFMVQFQRKI